MSRMRTTPRFLLITFIGSFAVICIERGEYFYTADVLGFGDVANLWLALLFGATYVAGSLLSHGASARLGEKSLLLRVVMAQIVVHAAMGARPSAAIMFSGSAIAGLLYGLQWPVIESYVGAGQTAAGTRRVIGLFNLSWAVAIPVTLAVAGPIIHTWPRGLFFLPAALNAAMLGLLLPAGGRPEHVPDDHPARPPADELARLRRLLLGHRWLMLVGYASMFILAPLLPRILEDLGFAVQRATALSGLLDLMRVTAFAVLFLYRGWHGARWLVVGSAAALPAGFFMVLFGQRIGMVLGGEVLFGLAMGGVYYGALHYALVVRNAAVGAGGAHEGLIGGGFALGPAIGLLGIALAPALGGRVAGSLVALAPLFVLCVGAALLAIRAPAR